MYKKFHITFVSLIQLKNLKMKSKILVLFVLLITFACQQDDSLEINEALKNPAQENNQVPVGREMIVGKRLKNPYSIENLNKAREIINKQHNKVGKGSVVAKMKATHLYIKFKPTTEQHCKTLLDIDENSSMTLHAYPIGSEILQEGTTPLAEGITNAGLNELYAVIPVGDPIPNIPYIILDRIIPDPDNELLEAVSFYITDNHDELSPKLNLEDMFKRDVAAKSAKGNSTKFLGLFGGDKWWPQGNLLIHDTELNENVGLRQAKVSIGWWFKWRRVDTNDNGTFKSDRSFKSRKVRIRIKWKSNIATIRKSWNEILGIAISDHVMSISRDSNGPTRTIPTSNEHLWYKGTVHNGLVKVNDFFAAKGMSGRIHKANVWVSPGNHHRGAALMLKKYTCSWLRASKLKSSASMERIYLLKVQVSADLYISASKTAVFSVLDCIFFPMVVINIS